MNAYKLIVEKNDDGYWGQVDTMPGVLSQGDSLQALIANTREAIELHHEEAGQENQDIDFELVMDIQAFFSIHAFINITSLAERIGMNASLLRQYAKGIKYPSLAQVERIEHEIKQIGTELSNTQLQPV